MNICGFQFYVIGATSRGFPLPSVTPNTTQGCENLAFINLGPADIYVRTGTNLGVVADTSATLVAAGPYATQTGMQRSTAELASGVVQILPLVPGTLAFAAICPGGQVINVAFATATFNEGDTSLTVASATGISIGNGVQGAGIGTRTTVTSIEGLAIGLSSPATSGETDSPVVFTTTAANPSVLAVAIGI
jgi:hypothetical protein